MSDKTFDAAIRENGEVINIDIENKKIPETPYNPDIPKTGDDSTPDLLLGLMGVSAFGLIISAKKRRYSD